MTAADIDRGRIFARHVAAVFPDQPDLDRAISADIAAWEGVRSEERRREVLDRVDLHTAVAASRLPEGVKAGLDFSATLRTQWFAALGEHGSYHDAASALAIVASEEARRSPEPVAEQALRDLCRNLAHDLQCAHELLLERDIAARRYVVAREPISRTQGPVWEVPSEAVVTSLGDFALLALPRHKALSLDLHAAAGIFDEDAPTLSTPQALSLLRPFDTGHSDLLGRSRNAPARRRRILASVLAGA